MKINRTLHVLLAIIFITGLNFKAGPVVTPSSPLMPEKLLSVDTTLDSNAAAYQGCRSTTSGDCSLRGAISRANAEPSVLFTILLPPGTYRLTLPGDEDANRAGDLDVRSNVIIDRQSTGDVVVSAGGLDRVFQFFPEMYAEINNLTIIGGQAGPSKSGGGILNAALLYLTGVTVTGNQAGGGRMARLDELLGETGGSGGGIENLGELILQDCTISSNQAGTGGDTLPEYPGYQQQSGGVGGAGGGIANRGSLEIFNSVIQDNQAGTGGKGKPDSIPPWGGPPYTSIGQANSEPNDNNVAGDGGDGGSGGGIFNGG